MVTFHRVNLFLKVTTLVTFPEICPFSWTSKYIWPQSGSFHHNHYIFSHKLGILPYCETYHKIYNQRKIDSSCLFWQHLHSSTEGVTIPSSFLWANLDSIFLASYKDLTLLSVSKISPSRWSCISLFSMPKINWSFSNSSESCLYLHSGRVSLSWDM